MKKGTKTFLGARQGANEERRSTELSEQGQFWQGMGLSGLDDELVRVVTERYLGSGGKNSENKDGQSGKYLTWVREN